MDPVLKFLVSLLLVHEALKTASSFINHVYHKGFAAGVVEGSKIDDDIKNLEKQEEAVKQGMKESGMTEDEIDSFVKDLHAHIESVFGD